jgi:ParB family chromosome partitioning protein
MERLEQYDTFSIPITDIQYDSSFNCRGAFTAQSVVDLADSIKENGLQFPIVVQPTTGKLYRLLAGHRRFKAVTTFLKWTTIPATIRHDLTEHQARILNLTENLERKDLNILEEAQAIQHLYPDGVSLRTASKELKRSTQWIHVRLRLLQLPKSIQKKAAAGLLNAMNIEAIWKLPQREQVKAAEDIIKSKRERGKNARLPAKLRRRIRPRKSKAQISKMVALLMDANLSGLPLRLLTWAAGYITDQDIKDDIHERVPEYQFGSGGPDPFGDDPDCQT